MKKTIIAAAAIAAFAAASPAAAQSSTANASASANARLIKPLALEKLQDLNFGTIVLGAVTTNQVVSVNGTTVSCGASGGGLTCTGSAQSAAFRVTGTQGQSVSISIPAGIPMSGSNGGALNFVPNAPASVLLGNSGAPGNSFNVGGSVTIDGDTVDGVYTGQIDVTVNY